MLFFSGWAKNNIDTTLQHLCCIYVVLEKKCCTIFFSIQHLNFLSFSENFNQINQTASNVIRGQSLKSHFMQI